MPNALYYGDNLDVLRDSIPSESVDLIYLDPPFNSQASYNVLFKGPSVKGGENVGVGMVRDLIAVVEREGGDRGPDFAGAADAGHGARGGGGRVL
jgi:16S rRNA G966 N2-methylase RsmD